MFSYSCPCFFTSEICSTLGFVRKWKVHYKYNLLLLLLLTQVVRVGQTISNSITLSTGAPQGCVLSPLLYSLYTYDCVSSHSSTSIVKFADDTVLMGFIADNNETAYLDEVEKLTTWCQLNNLSLNISKTKEMVVDFRRRPQRHYTPLNMGWCGTMDKTHAFGVRDPGSNPLWDTNVSLSKTLNP